MLVSIHEAVIDRDRDAHVGSAPSAVDDRKNARRDAVRVSLTAPPQQEQLVDDDSDTGGVVTDLDHAPKIRRAGVRGQHDCHERQCRAEPNQHPESRHHVAFEGSRMSIRVPFLIDNPDTGHNSKCFQARDLQE